jgi:hypothetical protein
MNISLLGSGPPERMYSAPVVATHGIGVGVKVAVWVGVGMGVKLAVGTGIGVDVKVGAWVGVSVGPDSCPGLQLETKKPASQKRTIIIPAAVCCLVFITHHVGLGHHCRAYFDGLYTSYGVPK